MKTSRRNAPTDSRPIGAIVIGGEHPGLGIARSLGRRGIPVCVIDDQHSISQFSKYVTRVVRVKDLRDEHNTVESVLEVGRRYGLEGWVLFPTRDETVAAFSSSPRSAGGVFSSHDTVLGHRAVGVGQEEYL